MSTLYDTYCSMNRSAAHYEDAARRLREAMGHIRPLVVFPTPPAAPRAATVIPTQPEKVYPDPRTLFKRGQRVRLTEAGHQYWAFTARRYGTKRTAAPTGTVCGYMRGVNNRVYIRPDGLTSQRSQKVEHWEPIPVATESTAPTP